MTDARSTYDVLGVQWNGAAELLPGATAFGLWRRTADPADTDLPAADHWPRGTLASTFVLRGESWRITETQILFGSRPDSEVWNRAVAATLEQLVAAGADVAWFGLELFFAEPPWLFDPDYMSGVYALLVPGERLRLLADVEGFFAELPPAELNELRARFAPSAPS